MQLAWAHRPTLPPGPFDESRWADGSGQGGAVRSILEAGSPTDLVPEESNLPARVERGGPPVVAGDPMSVIDGLNDAQLIRAVQHRISGIAGEDAPFVDRFLSDKLDDLEAEPGFEGYGGDDDDGDDDDDDLYGGM